MSKQVKQFRFYDYNNTHNKNYPTLQNENGEDMSGEEFAGLFINGNLFADYRIIQLGIQSLPGTQFYLNNSIGPIIIGHTGIYELNVDGLTEITSLKFSADSISAINSNANSFLIVDIIYEEEDES